MQILLNINENHILEPQNETLAKLAKVNGVLFPGGDGDYLEYGSMSLEFVQDPRHTKMFNWLGEEAFLFENYNMTYNAHHQGMNPEKFKSDKGLSEIFHHTAISYMPDGRPFVASVESDKYPFFGTQFHPEKAARVYREDLYIDHSWLSINLNKHFAEYFVYQTRQNPNNYGTYSETQRDIIQNYDLIVSDQWFDTVYVFKQF
ncbi:gamma-glutamyl hydrolase a-like [Stylonychia lemnae]|uniref:Gamma-glutamyl hydrolase a-like n=1 Tax=Stylonychia lemnae TaxID=5949 RepID=A0A078A4F0_STYLE|nr:gamma-glutamyl hydrolase a-like [Stylonychia lemnae]|eukprot:CDW75644.1 gamma-glutamyl hydrolase a-like [Stylonychia lemnae]